MDGCGTNSNCMSWLRLFGRAVIQILLNYLKGQQTDDDVIQIKALANTDTATWPDEFVKVYLNNYLAFQENEDCIGKLDSEVVVIKAQDGNKEIETNTCSISIPDNMSVSNCQRTCKIEVMCWCEGNLD